MPSKSLFTLALKRSLIEHCTQLIEQKIQDLNAAIYNAQQQVHNQEKSSAGDKYETATAMGQQDMAMYGAQLEKIKVEKNNFLSLPINPPLQSVTAGHLIETENNWYYIGYGGGKIVLNNCNIISLSTQAPLSKAMLGASKGEVINFNNQRITILNLI